MNSGTPPLGINVTHNVGNINDAIGFFPKAWRATKKYSVNNTLPILAVNAWLQFSLAYVAAVVVTSHDMSFITNILNSKAMPAYALASVILGTILLTSLIIRHAHKQEIKDEMLKNGKNTIDREIRGGESDGINEIAQNALTIEIVPDTSLIGNKKENFSIVLPISGRQGEILENKRQENRNKIVLLTVPYVLSGLTVAGALGKFGFANIQSWKQWTFIAAVGVIAIVGACVTLSKLGSNEVDNACNTVKRFDNEDILLPFRKGSVLSVMENKFESKEKNDLQSQALKLFERFLTGFKNDVCGILDKHLIEANTSFKECLLNPSNANIDKVLTLIRNDIKTLLYNLEESVTKDVNEVKNISGKAITDFFTGVKGELTNKLNQLEPGVIGRLFFTFSTLVCNRSSSEVSGSHPERVSEEVFYDAQDWETQIENLRENLKKELTQELQKLSEKLKNKQVQPNEPNSSSESDLGKQQDKEKKAREKNELLKSQQRTKELEKENTKLEKKLSEQEKTDERQEKINGKPSEFLYYVLESIKLGEKDNKVEATLRNLNNKIIIHWKDGSQTICHIKKQGNLQIEPSAAMFTDPSVQAAWEMVRG